MSNHEHTIAGTPLGIPNQNIARPASIILSMSVEERREQRRYETARDVFAGFAANPYRDCSPENVGDVAYLSRSAFEWADAFLAELDKPVAAPAPTFKEGQFVRVKGELHGSMYEVKSVYDTHVIIRSLDGALKSLPPSVLESAEPSPK